MQNGCPVCNGLEEVCLQCPRCSAKLEDGGMVEDYYGPYSPYDEMNLYEPPQYWNLADRVPCVHLFFCNKCGHDLHVGFKQLEM